MGIPSSKFTRLTIATALTVCALEISLVLRSYISPNSSLCFLAVVFVSSWFLGRAAGLLATGLSTVAMLFFFAPTYNSFSIANWTDAARVVTFFFSSILVTFLATAMRQSRTHLEETLSSICDAVIVIGISENVTYLNPVAEGLTGWSLREARKKRLSEILSLQDEKTGDELSLPMQSVLREGKSFQPSTHKMLISRDGHKVVVEESGAPIRDENGRVVGAIFIFRDVTSRREVQDQASQSQKMEAVGRLAGGVAGDFNQLLTVISGFSDILRRELAEGNPLHRYANEIHLAGSRAAGLTRQLLALGRSQSSELKALEPSTLIHGMETMLRRLMGGKVDVLIMQSPGVGQVKGDASQIEQMIVNLAMNSRDAMPDGGKFVIEVSNTEIEDSELEKRPGVAAGKYVMIAVSDTGTGMDAETRGRLFEPFFTTKEKGKATGLGLSIVYGIVQQCKGYINVYSQLGSGTIFEIYLPREASASPTVMPSHRKPARQRGTETILVADDEDGVRKLVHAVLATNGYNVLEARDGREALAIYENNDMQIDMVVTDIVMPNMTGLELGERLKTLNAKLRVLYISGYRDSPVGGTELDRGRIFMPKPFTPDDLLTRVRELLDGPMAASKEA